MKLSAVILDFDGVLIDTETISRNAWMQAASEFGFEFPESLYEEIVGNSVLAARKRITKFVDGLIDMDQYMDRAAAIYNGTMATNGIDVMPGVIELIEFIREHNLKTAIATSTTSDQAEWKLSLSGLTGIIDDVITGDQVKNGKPAPDIFLMAAKQIAVEPSECAVIEDSYAGLLGASSAGMVPIMVPSTVPSNDATDALAYAVVPSLHGTIDILLRMMDPR